MAHRPRICAGVRYSPAWMTTAGVRIPALTRVAVSGLRFEKVTSEICGWMPGVGLRSGPSILARLALIGTVQAELVWPGFLALYFIR